MEEEVFVMLNRECIAHEDRSLIIVPQVCPAGVVKGLSPTTD